jgi:hypothetical protein
MKYFAYEILTPNVSSMYVDIDPKAFRKELGRELAAEEVEEITVGTVEADTFEDALNEIRADNWTERFNPKRTWIESIFS